MSTTHTFKDIASSLVTSAYKWLTQTLYTAQNQFTTRPYFTAKVIDDTIQPNNSSFSGTGTPSGNGSMATAPNGTVYCVGVESGSLKVKWDTALNAVAGVWRNSTTLSTTGDNFNDSHNSYSIAISDYIAGTFQVDVWYFGNFTNDGSNLHLFHQNSTDGGLTWNKTELTLSSIPNNSLGNVSLAARTPYLENDTGITRSGCFYIKPNGSLYDVYYAWGNWFYGWTYDVKWNRYVNSFDWVIHSLGGYRYNGIQYLVFSGYRTILDTAGTNSNYSIWLTALLVDTQNANKDQWMPPLPIVPVGSASATNKNSFTYPNASIVNGMIAVTFNATTVDSLAQTSQGSSAQVVTTNTNVQLCLSDNGTNFSYPSVFVGTDGAQFPAAGNASFVAQGQYLYLGGAGGYLWEYIKNNIVADVSQDIIGYQIQEAAGQPSALSLKIANADNKWVGASPTGAGAAAIARNRKVAIWQGYYNTSGTPELVPHSLYYIDDIQQVITSTRNDVTLTCRDLYKKLKTTVTKFSYQFNGPVLFSDIFDGTFQGNWNQVSGTWRFVSTVNPPLLELIARNGTNDNVITYVGSNGDSPGHLMRTFFRDNAAGTVHIYGVYIDSDNWLRLEIDCAGGSAWAVKKNVAGTPTTLDSGTLPSSISINNYYGVFVRRYSYMKFQFMIELNSDSGGNLISDYAPATTSYVFKSGGTGEYDLSSTFTGNTSWQVPFTVGFGCDQNGPLDYRWFFLAQFNKPNNLGSVFRSIARIASVFTFKLKYTWRELLFANNFSGGSVTNRKLTVTAGNNAMYTGDTFSNGEFSFKAKVTVASSASNAGFSLRFRHVDVGTNGQPEHYKFHMIQQTDSSTNSPTSARFERYVAGLSGDYYFYNTPYDVSNNPYSGVNQPGNMCFNIRQWNTYRIFMVDGWFWAFVNDIMVAAWNDNNSLIDYLTDGSWGFEADSNSTLQVKEITAPDFWKPVQVFSFNPGDDAENAIESLIQQLRAFFFSDLLGRFKAVFLNSTDTSTYTYQNQLTQQTVDVSDKEYVSQVSVYGNGVIATSRDTTLMAGVPTRERVIVDYTITTQQDAQTRADNELINSNQYLNQYAPRQIVNVGAELFDAVTIVNTGNNTSGVDGTSRVYSQEFNEGGGTNNSDYSLEVDTGDL